MSFERINLQVPDEENPRKITRLESLVYDARWEIGQHIADCYSEIDRLQAIIDGMEMRTLTECEQEQYDKEWDEWTLEQIQDCKPFRGDSTLLRVIIDSSGIKHVVLELGVME